MNPTSTHPLYSVFKPDWETMRDCYRGERIVKERCTVYLPATPGQVLDGMKTDQTGWTNYQAYKTRARFPDFVAQAVEGLLGTMHRKPPNIKVPARMEPMLEKATIRGESLQMLLRRINIEQLVTGRLGILADVPDGSGPDVLPYITMYNADSVLNWDDRGGDVLEMAVVDESRYARKDMFEWELIQKCRVLLLQDGQFMTGTFSTEFDPTAMVAPSVAGRTLDRIPFAIINSKDVVPDPDDPPILGLARLALAVYRAEADYRQSLFMQGQDTLVVIGGTEEETRVGAGAKINVTMGGDAKYIGVSSQGLPEMRMALENDRKEAAETGGRMLNRSTGNAESGDALRIRVSAKTASLHQIVLAGAEGLKYVLQQVATWIGANPAEVEVVPNIDFADETLDGQTLVSYMTAKNLGAPLCNKSIHDLMVEQELTKLTYEEELEEIENEEPVGSPAPRTQDMRNEDKGRDEGTENDGRA